MPEISAPDSPAIKPAAAGREVLWWHAGWGMGVLCAGVGVLLSRAEAPPLVVVALALGVAPCLAALKLVGPEGLKRHGLLLAIWAACSALACVLTGGIAGPMAAWCLAPVAVASAFGPSRVLVQAAALGLMGACFAAITQLAGVSPAAPEAELAAPLAFLAIGTLGGGLGVGFLLTGRRLAKGAQVQREALAELEKLLSDQPHLIAVFEPDGRAGRAFGTPPEGVDLAALRTSGLEAAAQSADRPEIAAALGDAARDGFAAVAFTPQRALDGHVTLDLRRRSDGRLVGVLRDSARSQAREAALEAAKADAESLAAGKSRFLANMSHELRTPLNAIMGFSDIMRARMFGELPGKYVEYADLIHESGRHLLDLINDVLDMSKIEADKYELNREVMDAREPVSAALRIVRLQADEAGVQLRGVLPAQEIEIDADRRALKQIVLNLVSNALKFTPRGGAVTVTAQESDGQFELVVADTGVGIAPEDVAKLGRPYEQVGDNEKRTLGTGLGLSLVRAFAELHGGTMSIESRLGEGTAVAIRLPVLLPPPSRPVADNVLVFTPQR